MNRQKLSASILTRIQKEQITPIARWHFVLKHIRCWIFFALFVILGAIGVSVIIFAVMESDFDFFSYLHGTELQFWLSMIPIFWIVFFVIFAGLAVWGMRQTGKNYRVPLLRVMGLNLLLSIILGVVFYNIDGAENFEKIFADHMPMYRGISHQKMMHWRHPEEGRIAGEVVSMDENSILILDAFDQTRWRVDCNNAVFMGSDELQKGMKVRILGKPTGKNEFKADVIGLWRPPRRDMMMRMPFFGGPPPERRFGEGPREIMPPPPREGEGF